MAKVQNVPSTPPPPSRIYSPPTPKHGGFHDDWEPFTPRKSARISAKKVSIARTPSPSKLSSKQSSLKLQHRSPRSVNKSSSSIMGSPTSPIKKRAASSASTRNASGTVTAADSAGAAAQLGLMVPGQAADSTMLPTPLKTPAQQAQKDQGEIKAISRDIFQTKDDGLTPSRKRRAKKYNGLSLESFRAEEIEDEISIYTDSRERVPEVDNSIENPFYGAGARAGATTTRSSSKRIAQTVNIPGEGPQSLDEALVREDGIVYVFRGKKKFRKFKDVDESSDAPTHSVGEVSPLRPTRAHIKPRLLFPKATPDLEEEEAPTDIEDTAEETKADAEELTTPINMAHNGPTTPKAPKFAPASPPTTGRVGRAVYKPAAAVAKSTRSAKISPFDGWRRSKAPSSTSGQKRQADSLESDHPKRTRSSA
ncbi:uncharacterized protein MKZ38_004292 [Zalerion maritima]|uniref:Uncharacterized protein n=1 Tax=Zalerion maritima TaxID=339359 RepID=A0AAD5RLN5_9PEZI|nr:uncharacterized protein MKZ38_004292 [Zalerion maritima]